MKLLLIIDDIILLNQLDNDSEIYRYGAIQIKLFIYKSPSDLIEIKDIVEKERFHLALTATRGQFNGPYIQSDQIANSVNNYLSLRLRSNSILFNPEDIEKPPISIVNRSTAYFNVFLDIPKAVSLTTDSDAPDLELPRLDVISASNYYFAYLFDRNRCNFYLLNYAKDFPCEKIVDILSKIE
jgi:hypothetical protein